MGNEIKIQDLIEQTCTKIESEGVCTYNQAHSLGLKIIWSLYREGRFNSSVICNSGVLQEAFNAYRHACQYLHDLTVKKSGINMLPLDERSLLVALYRKAQDDLIVCENNIQRTIEEMEKLIKQ